MLTKTLSDGLQGYEIGPKLRALRLKKKMGLVELGRHTGLSPAMLSKVERGRLFPTLPTLLRIALVFSVGLDHFFSAPRERPALAVVRRKDRQRFPDRPGTRQPAYHFECLDFPATDRKMNAYFVEFEDVPPGAAKPHEHPGAEMLYLMEGRLVVSIGGDDHELERGDSMYFASDRPHTYRRVGSKRCTGIVVTAP